MGETDQWKSDGKCYKCRRQSYCKKTCTAARNGMERDIMSAFLQTKAGQVARTIMKETFSNTEEHSSKV